MSCAACFTGSTRTGTPVGTYKQLHGYNTYITPATPSPTAHTILYLPDVFSHKLVNNQLLADRYAAETGCTVIVSLLCIPTHLPRHSRPKHEYKHVHVQRQS